MPSKSKKQHNFMEAVAHNSAFAKKVGVPRSVGEDFAAADKGKHFKKGGINMAIKKRSVNPAMAMMAARAMQTPPAPGPQMAPPGAGMAPPGAGMKHGGLSKVHHKHLAHHHLAMAEHHMAQHEGHKQGGKIHGDKEHELNQAKELKRIAKEEESEAKGMKHGGQTKKYASGGSIKREESSEQRKSFKEKETMGPRGMAKDVESGSNKLGRFGESKVQKRGHTEDREEKMHNGNKNTIGTSGMKHGGKVHKMANGGSTSSRADGIAQRGKTKTKYC